MSMQENMFKSENMRCIQQYGFELCITLALQNWCKTNNENDLKSYSCKVA